MNTTTAQLRDPSARFRRIPAKPEVRLLRTISMILALALLPRLGDAADLGKESPPNLIAIVIDDQGLWAMRSYGNNEVQTPNMDRIGAEGIVYTNAFVATPVCSPSRATYLTGLWPTELGITDWIAPFEALTGVGLKNVTTWPQVLREQGYRTGLIGKWHLGMQKASHPTRLGFDYFMGFTGAGNKPKNPTLEVDGEVRPVKGFTPDLLVDDAIHFVRRNANRPFSLSLHFRAAHSPYGPVPEADSQPYAKLDPTVPEFEGADRAQLKERTLKYYASITSVDRNIGRLLNALDAMKLAENTIVMFTSDHGYNEGRHGVSTKGNGNWMAGGVIGPKRPNMWDTSIRVPLVVRWPAVIEPGTRADDVVSNLDMFRSVLGALSIPLPEGSKAHGVDFSPLFRGESIPDRKALFGMYDLHNAGLAYMRMIRTPKYKFVRHYKANFLNELYLLESDPEETHNVLRGKGRMQWSIIEQALQKRLTKWQESIDDPVLNSGY